MARTLSQWMSAPLCLLEMLTEERLNLTVQRINGIHLAKRGAFELWRSESGFNVLRGRLWGSLWRTSKRHGRAFTVYIIYIYYIEEELLTLQVAGPGVQLTLTKDTKVLRPEHTLSESGLYDGAVVTAIRHPEQRRRCLRLEDVLEELDASVSCGSFRLPFEAHIASHLKELYINFFFCQALCGWCL